MLQSGPGSWDRRTDGRTDRRTDKRTEWNQYTPQQLRCLGGIITAIKLRTVPALTNTARRPVAFGVNCESSLVWQSIAPCQCEFSFSTTTPWTYHYVGNGLKGRPVWLDEQAEAVPMCMGIATVRRLRIINRGPFEHQQSMGTFPVIRLVQL